MSRRVAALAMAPAQFRALGHALVDRIAAHAEGLASRPAGRVETPEALRALLDAGAGLPAHGSAPQALLDEAARLLLEHGPPGSHPRRHGYIAPAPAPIGVLAELLAAALNANVALWQEAPLAAEIEAQTLRWLAELVGWPAGGGGVLTSGGTAANGMALQLALAARLPQWRAQGLGGARLAVYASDQTHGWLARALEQAGLGRAALRVIACDAGQRIALPALAAAIAADRAAGVQPLMLVGSAGTTATGAVDPLAALAALAHREALWFHIDGAYGAPAACLLGTPHAAALLGTAAADLAALGAADSLALDPHKWLSAPIEAGCVLVRDAGRLAAAYGEQPSYYAAAHEPAVGVTGDGHADGGPDFHRLGPQNTRGFRALKVWLALRMAGREGYRRMIADDIALAQRLHARIAATPGLEAVTLGLSVATFRLHPPGVDAPAALDALNRALLARVQRDGRAGLSAARVEGRFLLRACMVNFQTEAEHLDGLPEWLAGLGSAR